MSPSSAVLLGPSLRLTRIMGAFRAEPVPLCVVFVYVAMAMRLRARVEVSLLFSGPDWFSGDGGGQPRVHLDSNGLNCDVWLQEPPRYVKQGDAYVCPLPPETSSRLS